MNSRTGGCGEKYEIANFSRRDRRTQVSVHIHWPWIRQRSKIRVFDCFSDSVVVGGDADDRLDQPHKKQFGAATRWADLPRYLANTAAHQRGQRCAERDYEGGSEFPQ